MHCFIKRLTYSAASVLALLRSASMSARPPTIKKAAGNGSKPATPPADKNAKTPPSGASSSSSSKKRAVAANAKGTLIEAVPTEVFEMNNDTDLRSETADATAHKQVRNYSQFVCYVQCLCLY